MALPENHPYLGLALGGTSLHFFLIAERCILDEVEASSVFVGLIATYFTFNMAYPKAVYPVLLFVQHFLLCINDKQAVPISLTKLLSWLDKMKDYVEDV